MTERHEVLSLINDADLLEAELLLESNASRNGGDLAAADFLRDAREHIVIARTLMFEAAKNLRQYGEDVWPEMDYND